MTARDSLERYCLEHTCRTCPVNTPELGSIAPDDECVVSLAIDALYRREARPADIDPAYEAARSEQGS